MGFETEDGMPSYLQPDKESDLEGELNLPSAPTSHAPMPAGRANIKVISFSLYYRNYGIASYTLKHQTLLDSCYKGFLFAVVSYKDLLSPTLFNFARIIISVS